MGAPNHSLHCARASPLAPSDLPPRCQSLCGWNLTCNLNFSSRCLHSSQPASQPLLWPHVIINIILPGASASNKEDCQRAESSNVHMIIDSPPSTKVHRLAQALGLSRAHGLMPILACAIVYRRSMGPRVVLGLARGVRLA